MVCAATSFCLLSVWGQALDAGALRVQVSDPDWDVPLAEASVTLVELERRAVTGPDGGVLFEQVPPGTYTVMVSRPGFERRLARNVAVAPGAVQRMDVPLAAVYTEMDEFVVKDFDISAGSDTALIELKMTSAAAIDAVSADTIKRAGASDAASALKLVAGATVQDGKYAVVRGLPDRYVSSQLNGIRLPSADADKRAVQLDQFPASMIESIQVSKTFMPDQQGDASGGAVDIRLKRVPESTVLAASVGVAYNDQITGKKMLTSRGGGVSYWGVDDGGLDRPFRVGDVLTSLQANTPAGNKPTQVKIDNWTARDAQTRAFSSDYGSSYKTAEPGTRWSATAGDSYLLAEDVRIGALGTFSYKNDMSGYSDGTYNNLAAYNDKPELYFDRVGSHDRLSKPSAYQVERGKESVLWGGTATVGFESPWSNIGLTYTRSQAADYTVSRSVDRSIYETYNKIWRSQSLYYSERTTETTMLQAEHPWFFLPDEMPLFGSRRFVFLPPVTDWSVSRNMAAQAEPDRRLFADLYDGVQWRDWGLGAGTSVLERRWRDIEETGSQYALNQKFPFLQWTETEGYLKAGAFLDKVERTYEQDTFIYLAPSGTSSVGGSYAGGEDDMWSDHFITGFPFIPDTTGVNRDLRRGWIVAQGIGDIDYRGTQEIGAWYLMGDLPLASFVSLLGGARVETTEMTATMRSSSGRYGQGFMAMNRLVKQPNSIYVDRLTIDSAAELEQYNPALKQRDVLPALGVKFTPIENLNLRLNWSETVARPTFKELMPVEFKESVASPVYFGNPKLKMAKVENYDARLEWMPSQGQIWSASYFYKKITDPIDMLSVYDNVNIAYFTPDNYPEGHISGVEFEARQHIGEWAGWARGLTAGANLALMESEVTRPEYEYQLVKAFGGKRTRRMVGQPEHLLGLNLTYDIESWGSAFGLFYTRRGDALVAGDSVNGDSYYAMIFENPVDTLDFSFSQKIYRRWTLGFRVKNMLNPDIEMEYRTEGGLSASRSSYKLGREYSMSLSCEW